MSICEIKQYSLLFHYMQYDVFVERLEGSGQPYFVRRSRNHMLPVYLDVQPISKQKTTLVKHVVGDIHVSLP